jgi:hypothetical protein
MSTILSSSYYEAIFIVLKKDVRGGESRRWP